MKDLILLSNWTYCFSYPFFSSLMHVYWLIIDKLCWFFFSSIILHIELLLPDLGWNFPWSFYVVDFSTVDAECQTDINLSSTNCLERNICNNDFSLDVCPSSSDFSDSAQTVIQKNVYRISVETQTECGNDTDVSGANLLVQQILTRCNDDNQLSSYLEVGKSGLQIKLFEKLV